MGDILEAGMTEIIGEDEQVAQNQFAASAEVALAQTRHRQGVIRSVGFYFNAPAPAISPAGELLFLDADPAVAAADTDLLEAEWLTMFGNVPLANADVIKDATATGGIALYHDLYIPFHMMGSIWLVFKLTSATQYNSAGGDNETLDVNFWYEPRF